MDNSKPAFPNSGNMTRFWESGLTQRELFAAMAMQGMQANSSVTRSEEVYASWSVRMADALLAALKEETK